MYDLEPDFRDGGGQDRYRQIRARHVELGKTGWETRV